MINVKSLVAKQLESLLEEEKNVVTNLANASALIFQSYENVNWAGFYIYNSETNELDLGPFQGNVACILNQDQE